MFLFTLICNQTSYAGLVWSLQRRFQLLKQPEVAAGRLTAAAGEGLQGHHHHLLQLHHQHHQHLEQPLLLGHTLTPIQTLSFKKGEETIFEDEMST